MRYRLVITTDGRPSLLERTLRGYVKHVVPAPTEVAIVDDSADPRYCDLLRRSLRPKYATHHGTQLGFCRSVIDAWGLAAIPGVDFVLWLEDDLEFVRDVDLRDVAAVLHAHPELAQMAFYRDPVSDEEKVVGGYVALRPDTYEQREEDGSAWLEHRNHWTTNASLFRRELAETYPWRDEEFCEGKFGIRLRAERPETTFGIWGYGDVFTHHIGVRAGFGY